MRILTAFLLFGLASAYPAFADTDDDLRTCRAEEDSLKRLGCYDDLAKGVGAKAASAEPEGKYRKIKFDDLRVDLNTLGSERVEVAGSLMVMGDMGMLRAGMMDMSPVYVKIDDLPRSQRLKILKSCPQGCQVVVKGMIDNVFVGLGLVAEDVAFR